MKWFMKITLILNGDTQISLHSQGWTWATASQFHLLPMLSLFETVCHYLWPTEYRPLWASVVATVGRVDGKTCVFMISTWAEDILLKVIESLFPHLWNRMLWVRFQAFAACGPGFEIMERAQLRGLIHSLMIPSSMVQPLWCDFLPVFPCRVF